jgi:hypothetical protein
MVAWKRQKDAARLPADNTTHSCACPVVLHRSAAYMLLLYRGHLLGTTPSCWHRKSAMPTHKILVLLCLQLVSLPLKLGNINHLAQRRGSRNCCITKPSVYATRAHTGLAGINVCHMCD